MAGPNTKPRTEDGNRTTITALFAAARGAITRQDDEPQRGSGRRRKDGDTETGRGAIRHPFRRAARMLFGSARRIARATFKGAKPITAREEPLFDPFADAAACMADTLDWMNPYNPPDISGIDIDADFGAQQDQCFPQP
jgi:hypothetical protein